MEIRLGEDEFRPLLDREKVLADVKRAFSAQLELLREVTNYGTKLIPRCFSSSDKGLRDIVILGVLLRQVVSMLDAVEVLATGGAVYAAGLQARALFEAATYIDWILKADTETKVNYYYVHNLRRLRRWAQRFQAGSPEASAVTLPDLESMRNPEAIQQAKDTVSEVDRVLSQPKFAVANKAFDKCSRNPAKADRAWYVPLGIPSVAALVNTVGRSAEYVVFYAIWSETMHSSSYSQHVQIGKGRITFEPIRYLEGFDALFRFSAATAFHCYRTILKHYRPGELPVFSRKYLEHWQKAFMEVPKIEYEVTTSE